MQLDTAEPRRLLSLDTGVGCEDSRLCCSGEVLTTEVQQASSPKQELSRWPSMVSLTTSAKSAASTFLLAHQYSFLRPRHSVLRSPCLHVVHEARSQFRSAALQKRGHRSPHRWNPRAYSDRDGSMDIVEEQLHPEGDTEQSRPSRRSYESSDLEVRRTAHISFTVDLPQTC